jgi:ribosomal-protein-serine acetyltransferase
LGGFAKIIAVRIQLSEDSELRALSEADADELDALVEANRRHLAPWMPWAAEQRIEGTREFLRATVEKRGRGEALDCAVVLDGRIVGSAGYPRIDPIARTAEIGYWVAEQHQGRGLMTRAVIALIEHGFGELGFHRIEIRAAADNARSRAIPERLGFTQEGVLREADLAGGRRHDLVVYGLLASDRAARSG